MSLVLPKNNGTTTPESSIPLPEHMVRIAGHVAHFTIDRREVMCVAPTGLNECTIMFTSGGGIKTPQNIDAVERLLWGKVTDADCL